MYIGNIHTAALCRCWHHLVRCVRAHGWPRVYLVVTYLRNRTQDTLIIDLYLIYRKERNNSDELYRKFFFVCLFVFFSILPMGVRTDSMVLLLLFYYWGRNGRKKSVREHDDGNAKGRKRAEEGEAAWRGRSSRDAGETVSRAHTTGSHTTL